MNTSIPKTDEGISKNFCFKDLCGSKIPEINLFDIIWLKNSWLKQE